MTTIKFEITNILNQIDVIDYDSIFNYFKENYNNEIYIKKINENLLLLHNTVKNIKKKKSNIINECRSIIIDISLPKPKIISYTHDNIEYLKQYQYVYLENDQYEESYEGTLISVYNYDNKWYFSTSRCSDINKSYFYNKENTFGKLFDECLNEYYKDVVDVRVEFTKELNPENCYYFVVIHHENKYIIDYTNKFGENYKKLIHVFTRNQETQEIVNNDLNLEFILTPIKYDTYEDALKILLVDDKEGIIVKRKDDETNKIKLLKIHSDKYWEEKTKNPNYANQWLAYIDIYLKNDPNFKIKDYQENKKLKDDIYYKNSKIDITGMICLLFKGTSDLLLNIVMYYTNFDTVNKRYTKINEDNYKKLENKKYNILKKQITILQTLINKNIIKNSADIITHIRNYVPVEDIIGLFIGIKELLLETDIFKISNKYYSIYLNILLEKINN
jgi:hypothetical protein